MKNQKKFILRQSGAALLLAASLLLSACGSSGGSGTGAGASAPAVPTPGVSGSSASSASAASVSPAAQTQAQKRISSVEVYNRTGRIQREDVYDPATGSVSYSIAYSYNDAGGLTEIKKSAGGIGSDKVLETRLYSGNSCTQRIVYDSSGSTQEVYYWTYDKKGNLTKERLVEMLPAESGYGSSGKRETVTTYDSAGNAESKTVTEAGQAERNDYVYGDAGVLILDSYSHSADGKTFRTFHTVSYEYDGEIRLVKKTTADALGTVTEAETWEYGDDGLLAKDTVYSSDELTEENQLCQTYYEYNDQGVCTFCAEYRGEDSTKTYYEYDAKGNLTAESVVSYTGGEQTDSTVTTWQYDAHSNPVREAVQHSGAAEEVSLLCEYTYYSDGKIQTKTNYEYE